MLAALQPEVVDQLFNSVVSLNLGQVLQFHVSSEGQSLSGCEVHVKDIVLHHVPTHFAKIVLVNLDFIVDKHLASQRVSALE